LLSSGLLASRFLGAGAAGFSSMLPVVLAPASAVLLPL